MFSDTHFHFHHLVEDRGLDGAEILQKLCERSTFFALDIGTRADDLLSRRKIIQKEISRLPEKLQNQAHDFIFYSAGIWPDVEEIKDRHNALKKLKASIKEFCKTSGRKLTAIGECGIDHHWNPAGADGRSESDFDTEVFKGEKELFCMQLEYAQNLDLPVIVHSRDAFRDTVDCIKETGYSKGIIHCYSYGLEEAKVFLDSGWYLAFGGATTYTKKSKMEQMTELLRYVPEDRLLLETDSPYLAPVPFRGQTNTPVLIEHVYNFIAAARNTTPQDLSQTVDKNIRNLFNLNFEFLQ